MGSNSNKKDEFDRPIGHWSQGKDTVRDMGKNNPKRGSVEEKESRQSGNKN